MDKPSAGLLCPQNEQIRLEVMLNYLTNICRFQDAPGVERSNWPFVSSNVQSGLPLGSVPNPMSETESYQRFHAKIICGLTTLLFEIFAT